MTWEDIMWRVLPPIGSLSPHITSAYGAMNRPRGSTKPHRGVDFNYNVGPNGQTGVNLVHPVLRSPVSGVVTNAGAGGVGRIAIRDANGFSHEILHTHTQTVKVGHLVGAGQPIGTMGNTGVDPANPGNGAYHVHYQLRDPTGNVINPTEFWNRLDPGKVDPGEPAYLEEYQKYLRELDANSAPDAAPSDPQASFDNRSGNWGFAPASIAPPVSDQPESFDNRFGNWGRAPAGRFGDTGSPVLRALEKYRKSAAPDGPASVPAQGASWGMPSSPPNIIGTGGALGNYMNPSRGMPSSPSGIIGTGGVLGNYMDPSLNDLVQGAVPPGPSLPGRIAPDLSTEETEIASRKPVRYLSSRIAGQPQASMSNAGAQAVPPSPQPSEPLVGIFSGQPMLPFPLPPSIWRRPADVPSRSDDDEERLSRWLRLLSPS